MSLTTLELIVWRTITSEIDKGGTMPLTQVEAQFIHSQVDYNKPRDNWAYPSGAYAVRQRFDGDTANNKVKPFRNNAGYKKHEYDK